MAHLKLVWNNPAPITAVRPPPRVFEVAAADDPDLARWEDVWDSGLPICHRASEFDAL